MSLFDVIAASQHGACFDNLARRVQLSEGETARAVGALLPVLIPAFEGWISDRAGMVEFLRALARDGYSEARTKASLFSDNGFRDRGIALLRRWHDAGRLDSVRLAEAAAKAGLEPDTAAQVLPWVAVLLMSALHLKALRPLGWLVSDLEGAQSPASPFEVLADRLQGLEPSKQRPTVRRMLGSLLALTGDTNSAMRTA